MARMEFVTAVNQAESEDQGEVELFEFGLAGQEFTATLPTATQLALLSISFEQGSREAIDTVLNVLDGLLEGDGGKRLRKLVANGTVPAGLLFWGDELNDKGLIGSLVERVTGRPTGPSNDSSESPKSVGRRSTGRALSKVSTPSDSQPTAS